jgi:hypothetical protein
VPRAITSVPPLWLTIRPRTTTVLRWRLTRPTLPSLWRAEAMGSMRRYRQPGCTWGWQVRSAGAPRWSCAAVRSRPDVPAGAPPRGHADVAVSAEAATPRCVRACGATAPRLERAAAWPHSAWKGEPRGCSSCVSSCWSDPCLVQQFHRPVQWRHLTCRRAACGCPGGGAALVRAPAYESTSRGSR